MTSNYLTLQTKTMSLNLTLGPKTTTFCVIGGVTVLGSCAVMLINAVAKKIGNSNEITFKYNGASIEVK